MCAPQVVPSVASKVCQKCAEEKPAGEFPRNKLTNDGLHSYCKCAAPCPLRSCISPLLAIFSEL